MSNYVIGALSYEDKVTAEDGLFIAAALTAYDSETEPIYDPRYGDLTIETYGWSEIEVSKSVLDSRTCSDEELGLLSGAEYPIYKNENEVRTWKKKFKCVDEKDFIKFVTENNC